MTWSEFSPSRIVWTVLNWNPRELRIWAKPNPTGELSDRNAGFREHAIRAGGTIWLDSRWLQRRWSLVRWCVGSLHHDVMKVKQRKPPKVSMFFFIFLLPPFGCSQNPYPVTPRANLRSLPPFSFREIPRSTNKILEKLMETFATKSLVRTISGVCTICFMTQNTYSYDYCDIFNKGSKHLNDFHQNQACMSYNVFWLENFRAFQGISGHFSIFQLFRQKHPIFHAAIQPSNKNNNSYYSGSR